MSESNNMVVVPADAVVGVIKEVRAFGRHRLETGGFLLAPRGTSTISTVALAGDVGIVRRHNLFQVSALALDRLFTFADDHGLSAPAQFHSHGVGAFLSESNEKHGLCVEGFISVVVPQFFDPPGEMGEWGWWRYDGGRWITITAWRRRNGAADVVRFDEDGIRAT